MAEIHSLPTTSRRHRLPPLDDGRPYEALRHSLQVQDVFRRLSRAQNMAQAKDSLVALAHCFYVADVITCQEWENILAMFGQPPLEALS